MTFWVRDSTIVAVRILAKPNICMAMEFGSSAERKALTDALRFKNPNPSSRDTYDNPYYDGYVSFFLDPEMQKFPTGFLSHILGALERAGVHYVLDVLKNPLKSAARVDPNIFPGIVLRDYQIDAVNQAIRLGRGVVTAPPRSGKTLMQAAVAQTLGLKSVIFVQRASLVEQHVAALRKLGMDPGIVQGSTKEFDKLHTVAMLQTVWAGIQDPTMRAWLDQIDVMQVDEAHHSSSADTFYRAALSCPASWRLGYSGTPYSIISTEEKKFSENTWRSYGLFGPPIATVTVEHLQTIGLMVPVHVIQIKVPEDPNISAIDGNKWNNVYSAGVVENVTRNMMIVDATATLIARGYLPLILVKQVAHGEDLFAKIQEKRLAPLFVKGNKSILKPTATGSEWVQGSVGDAYARMMRGEAQALIATQVGDEGVDLPHVDALVLAVGGRADQVQIQRTFRPLTSTGSKDRSIVIDFDDRQHGVLKRHSAARRRIYRHLGFEPALVSFQEALACIPNTRTA